QDGFKKFQPKDNPLLTRQDLLDYFHLKNATTPGLNLAVPYLSTFSRAVNAPSWRPTTPEDRIGHYAARADLPEAENRNLVNVRDTNTGERLIKSRFPLNRLAMLDPDGDRDGPAPGTENQVLDYFGLTWDAGNKRWNYNHGQSRYIMTLEEV